MLDKIGIHPSETFASSSDWCVGFLGRGYDHNNIQHYLSP